MAIQETPISSSDSSGLGRGSREWSVQDSSVPLYLFKAYARTHLGPVLLSTHRSLTLDLAREVLQRMGRITDLGTCVYGYGTLLAWLIYFRLAYGRDKGGRDPSARPCTRPGPANGGTNEGVQPSLRSSNRARTRRGKAVTSTSHGYPDPHDRRSHRYQGVFSLTACRTCVCAQSQALLEKTTVYPAMYMHSCRVACPCLRSSFISTHTPQCTLLMELTLAVCG